MRSIWSMTAAARCPICVRNRYSTATDASTTTVNVHSPVQHGPHAEKSQPAGRCLRGDGVASEQQIAHGTALGAPPREQRHGLFVRAVWRIDVAVDAKRLECFLPGDVAFAKRSMLPACRPTREAENRWRRGQRFRHAIAISRRAAERRKGHQACAEPIKTRLPLAVEILEEQTSWRLLGRKATAAAAASERLYVLVGSMTRIEPAVAKALGPILEVAFYTAA